MWERGQTTQALVGRGRSLVFSLEVTEANQRVFGRNDMVHPSKLPSPGSDPASVHAYL